MGDVELQRPLCRLGAAAASVVLGESGYAGSPVVVTQTQYVFVPTNRFVDTDITSVRVSAQESATIFRQTTPFTHFGVSGGIVRNTGVPMETIRESDRRQD